MADGKVFGERRAAPVWDWPKRPIRWASAGVTIGMMSAKPALSVSRCLVISVGNLTLGGTGKTPMVEWLARWFRSHDVRVAIVSRGYGAVDGGQNDEARELEEKLPDVPHLQDPNRAAAARVAIDELATQLIVLDDGFQHRRLGRDLDIILIDAVEPFGYDRVFPRGMLREPLSGLRRADVIGLTRADVVNETRRREIARGSRRYSRRRPGWNWHISRAR